MHRLVPHFLVLALCVGCSTTRDYTPAFQPSSRQGLNLDDQVSLAFLDARLEKDEDMGPLLQTGVQKAYGPNVRIIQYFSPPSPGRVTIKVRVLRLQSDFGSRVISIPVVLNSQTSAAAAATDGWNTVVAAASSSSQTLGMSMVAEGWWIGSAEIEVEVVDLTKGRNVKFSFPLVTETRESNIWGYGSATTASKKAWKKTEAQLMKILDDVFLKVSEDTAKS